MIEEQLLQYGVLGLWTASLLVERLYQQKKLYKIIENNTSALNKCLEAIRKFNK